MSDKSKIKGFPVAKKDFKLVGVAIVIGVLAVGAFLYLGQEEDLTVTLPDTPRPKKPRPEPKSTPTEVVNSPQETPVATPTEKTPPQPTTPIVDNVLKEKADKLQAFKNLLKLEVTLPQGMNFVELDLDAGVAAMEGTLPGKKLLIMGAARTATPELIASYLREQKVSIPMLVKHDFKISGDLQNITPPKGSGISKITLIPGGSHDGYQIFAAYLERGDKKGSYVFLMEASPNQFTQFEGDFDIMVDSLKTKP